MYNMPEIKLQAFLISTEVIFLIREKQAIMVIVDLKSSTNRLFLNK